MPPLISVLGLRVSSFFLAALLAISLGASGLISLVQWLDVGQVDPQALERIFQGDQKMDPVLSLWLRVGTLPLILWVAWFFTVHFDGGSVVDIGLRRPNGAGKEALLAGCAGALIPMLWWLTILPMTDSVVSSWEAGASTAVGAWGLVSFALMFLLMAFQDELIYRGYVFSTFRRRWTWVHAAGLTNLLAVSLYAGHPEAGSAALLNLFLLGLILAAIREKTGSLWMSSLFVGILYVVQACVLSLPLHGLTYPRLFDHALTGPISLTGAEMGPQQSWVLTPILLIVVVLSASWVERESWTAAGPGESAESV